MQNEAKSGGWQPIETAPKDGTLIWAFWPVNAKADQQHVTEWTTNPHGEARWCDVADFIDWTQPTHWMPLPTPPASLAKGEE